MFRHTMKSSQLRARRKRELAACHRDGHIIGRVRFAVEEVPQKAAVAEQVLR